MKRTIIVFANSVKHGQYCVAGKDVRTGKWIRPVQTEKGRELSREMVCCRNPYGSFIAKPLQKIEMELIRPAPLTFQPENHVVNPDCQWQQRYGITLDELPAYLDHPEILWTLGNSSGRGENDRVSYMAIASGKLIIRQSLFLIAPEKFSIMVILNDEGQARVRAQFIYKNELYNLAITDPTVWKNYRDRPPGEYHVSRVRAICLSLAEPFQDYCYKLVAGVLNLECR